MGVSHYNSSGTQSVLKKLCEYNWASIVFNWMQPHIANCALWCKMKDDKDREFSEEEIESQLEGITGNEEEIKETGYIQGCVLALIVWFYEQTLFERMRSCTERIPRYLDWYNGLSSKVKRPHFQRQLYSLVVANVSENDVDYTKFEKPLREKCFITANYLEFVVDPNKLQTLYNTSKFEMLVKYTPVLIKFGVVPCPILKERIRDVSAKQVYVGSSFTELEEIEPDVMQNIIDDSDLLERVLC